VSGASDRIVLENVSKFYGEVLGVNRVHLSIPPGITSIVGPNGSGKTTMMNLMTGLLRPTRGTIRVQGIRTTQPEALFRKVGYCSQFDTFPRGMTGLRFLDWYLRLHGYMPRDAATMAWEALERVGLEEAAERKIAAYSKGMRQRIKLGQALAHRPSILVLDEPLNGLDPMARAEIIALFRSLSAEGMHVLVSSHILHEVDVISDRVVILSDGYVVAEGDIHGMRSELDKHPMQVLIRCDRPALVASRVFEEDHVVEVAIHEDRKGLLVRTHDADQFYLLLNRLVLEHGLDVERIAPADDDVHAVYQYLVREDGEGS